MKRTYFVVNGKVTEDNCNAVKEAFVASGATHIHFTDYTRTTSRKAVVMVLGKAYCECNYSWSNKAGCCGMEQMKEIYGNNVIGEYTTDTPVKRNTKAPMGKEVITGAEIKSVIGNYDIANHNWVWNEYYRMYVMEGNDKKCLKPKTAKSLLGLLAKEEK